MKRKITFLLCLLITSGFLHLNLVFADEICEDEPITEEFCSVEAAATAGKLPVVEAGAAIVMDMKSGRVLFEKNARSKRAMASTTKIMTGILTIENGNLNDVVTISKRAESIWGSDIGLKAGQKLTLRELLYGLMLNSGNDAAIAIAEHIGGTVEGFADMMNAKAVEIGAYDTSFKTPHGLDANGHYATAYDMALITRYALHNPVFSKIVGTKSASISIKGLYNTNEMLSIYPGADGVKTGYTGQAGRCLVTSATRDNWRIISVVLGCASRTKRAQSSKAILDYGFYNYRPYTLLNAGDEIDSVPVIKGNKSEVGVHAVDSISMPLKEEEYNSMQKEVDLPQKLEAPVSEGIEVGKLKFVSDGNVIAETALRTTYGVERKGAIDYLKEMLLMWQKILKEGL